MPGGLRRTPPFTTPSKSTANVAGVIDVAAPSPKTNISSKNVIPVDTPVIHRYKRLCSEVDGVDYDKLSCDVVELKSMVMSLCKDVAFLKSLLVSVVGDNSVSRIDSNLPISYANVLKPKPQESLKVVIINPKTDTKESDAKESDVIREKLSSKLNATDYAVSSVRNTKKGGVAIDCASSADRNNLKTKVVNELGDQYNVSIPVKHLPRVRIFGLSKQYDEVDFVKVFKEQNQHILPTNCHFKVEHMFANKANTLFGAKLEVDANSFNSLLEAGKVNIGWSSCYVSEDLNIRRCYKCWGFNHTAAKCRSEVNRCSKCGGDHQFKECTSTSVKCAVCCDAVKNRNLQIDTNHPASSSTCPSFLHMVDLAKRHIDYAS